ncbi:hypothetical protein PN4B1_16870 [Paenibacillus naphthalenovorans]|nr:hypothetical protein PN4B1_16870 [Paenibacillus naphthalenovorans]
MARNAVMYGANPYPHLRGMPDEPKKEAHTTTVDLVGMTLLLLFLRIDRIRLAIAEAEGRFKYG